MPNSLGGLPIAPDPPDSQDPIHAPAPPCDAEHEEDDIEMDVEEDTGSDPWWM